MKKIKVLQQRRNTKENKSNNYYLEYSDYWPYLYCYHHKVLVHMSFGILQVSNSRVHTESRTEPSILTTGVACFKSVNYVGVQMLRYNKYSLLVLPVVGIEPMTSRGLHWEIPSHQTPYQLRQVWNEAFEEGHIGRNVVIIAINMRPLLRIFEIIITTKLHLWCLDK